MGRYVTAQPPTQGADAGMYDAFSEIHKFSTWQQVPQRGNPFCDKGGLREQRQSESCSKRHHGTREEDFSGRQRVFRDPLRLHKYFSTNVSTTHSSLSPLFPPKTSQARARTEGPPPPRPRPPPPSCRSHSQNPVKHGGRL